MADFFAPPAPAGKRSPSLHSETELYLAVDRLGAYLFRAIQHIPKGMKAIVGEALIYEAAEMAELVRRTNIALDVLDQFVKHRLGARHYIRYVDDFVLLHESPRQLNEWLAAIGAFLPARLGVRLNPRKTILQPIERGIDFVGQVIRPHRRTIRRRTFNAALHRIERAQDEALAASATSYLGLLRQASHNHRDRARLANLARRRGHAVDHALTKVYPWRGAPPR